MNGSRGCSSGDLKALRTAARTSQLPCRVQKFHPSGAERTRPRRSFAVSDIFVVFIRRRPGVRPLLSILNVYLFLGTSHGVITQPRQDHFFTHGRTVQVSSRCPVRSIRLTVCFHRHRNATTDHFQTPQTAHVQLIVNPTLRQSICENRELMTRPRVSLDPFLAQPPFCLETRISTLAFHHLGHVQGCPFASEPMSSMIKLLGLMTHGTPGFVSFTLAIPIDPECTCIILASGSCGSTSVEGVVLSWSVRTMGRRSPDWNLPSLT